MEKIDLILTPNLNEYLLLSEKYHNTISCTCNQVAIEYKTFVTVNYTLHGVCSSGFIQSDWIEYLVNDKNALSMSVRDFRYQAAYIFQTLASLCNLMNTTVQQTIARFYEADYRSMTLLTESDAKLFVANTLTGIRSSSSSEFLTMIQTLSNIIHANYIFSAAQTNIYTQYIRLARRFGIFPVTYDNCSCAINPYCASPSAFYETVSSSVREMLWQVPGIFVGCYISEALRRSSLNCFYNQTCVDALAFYKNESFLFGIQLLNIDSSDQYSIDTTVATLVDNLMINDWNWSISYDKYFQKCDPLSCSYVKRSRNNILFIISVIIGLLGGIITCLRFTVPYVVHIVRTMILRRDVRFCKFLLFKIFTK